MTFTSNEWGGMSVLMHTLFHILGSFPHLRMLSPFNLSKSFNVLSFHISYNFQKQLTYVIIIVTLDLQSRAAKDGEGDPVRKNFGQCLILWFNYMQICSLTIF